MNGTKILFLCWLGILIIALGLLPVLEWTQKPAVVEGRPVWIVKDDLQPCPTNIAVDRQGQVWIGGPGEGKRGYLAVWDGKSWQQFDEGDLGLKPDVNEIVVDSQDNVWIITDNDVAIYRDGAWQTYPRPFPNGDCTLYFLAVDHQGTPWVSGKCGLAVFRQGAWQEVHGDGLPESTKNFQVFIDSQDRVWVSSEALSGTRGEIYILKDGTWTGVGDIPLPDPLYIEQIVFHPDGRAFVITTLAGVASLKIDASLRNKEWQIEDGIGCCSVAMDAAGRIYSELGSNGLSVKSGNAYERIENAPKSKGGLQKINHIIEIVVGPDGRVWFLYGGLYCGATSEVLYGFDYPRMLETPVSSQSMNYKVSWFTWLTLGLLVALWFAVLLLRPLSDQGKPGDASNSPAARAFTRRWIILNGMAWLAAVGIAATAYNLLIAMDLDAMHVLGLVDNLNSGQSAQILLALLVALIILVCIVPAGLVASAQWAVVSGFMIKAPRWAWYTFVGLLLGASLSIILIGLTINMNFYVWGLCSDESMLCLLFAMASVSIGPLLLIVEAIVAFALASAFAGRRQSGLLDQEYPAGPGSAWRKKNLLWLFILLGPLGGFLYGAITARTLRTILFAPDAAPRVTAESSQPNQS